MNQSKRQKRGFVERTIGTVFNTVAIMWWFVFVLATNFHGSITKSQLVHTAISWSIVWAVWLILVLIFGALYDIYKARREAKGRFFDD